MESSATVLRKLLKPSTDLEVLVPEQNPLLSIVAFYGEQPIGLVSGYKRDEKELHVSNIFVNVVHWGKGIGTNLLTMLEKLAKEKSFDKLSLIVYDRNLRAKGLYTNLGFAKVGLPVNSYENWIKRIK